MFAVGVKLRQVGPIMFASAAYCIVKLPSVLYRGGGEKCLQLQVLRDATVVWAGGLHSGWNARMRVEWGSARREVGPPIHAPLLFGKLLFCYPGSLPRGGEIACDDSGTEEEPIIILCEWGVVVLSRGPAVVCVGGGLPACPALALPGVWLP